MSELLIKIDGISKAFGGVQALQNINLEIFKAEVLCLAGENGCGKSTLIKILSGFYTSDSGEIFMDGIKYENVTPRESMKAGIQVVYQDFSVFPNLTVTENIALNTLLVNKKKLVNGKKMREIAEKALERIGAKLPLNAYVENLSVADKQLVAIARSLLNNAKLIVFDEPTSALTHKEVEGLFKVIKQLKQQGLSILFVSHKLDEMFEICDRICVLNNGKNIMTGDITEFDKKKLVYHMTGKEYKNVCIASEVEAKNPILEVDNLSLRNYFSNVSFKLYPGEVLGITGLLGSGRTELALSIYGVKPATSGLIKINNAPVKIKSVKDGINNKICYIPEDRLTEGLFLDQSITKNIVISSIDKVCNCFHVIENNTMEQNVKKWVKDLGIKTSDPNNNISTLSGGNQQKAVLAKGLAINPDIIILNGPTVGVDIGSKMDISLLIQSIAKQGSGVILISDDSSEILMNCKRILMIKNGRISGEYESSQFTEESLYTELIN